MDIRSFNYEGEIRGQMRPRATAQGCHARLYKDRKDTEYEASILEAYLRDWRGLDPIHGAFIMNLYVSIEIPKSTTKKRRLEIIANDERPLSKPDLDNVIKSVLDALNGVAFDDDKNCVSINACKDYGTSEYMRISIQEVE